MKFSVETWAPEYGFSVDAESLTESVDAVDTSIEVEPADWEPITPTGTAAALEQILFVDGVRRIEARVWIHEGDRSYMGVCASVAAGSVLCTPGEARVAHAVVQRGLFAAPIRSAGSIVTRHGTYEYRAVASDAPDAAYLGIHEMMTDLELAAAREHSCDLVVFDGPLRGRKDAQGVGYVKTQHVQYLPDDLMPVLGRLGDGHRSPVFHLGSGGYARFSWYLRLPGPRSHPLSGVVRLELPSVLSVPDALSRADAVSALIPRYASRPHREPRAPQNLYPVAGLEQQLRHRLGDALLLERALRIAAA
jgi:hypothetical protein